MFINSIQEFLKNKKNINDNINYDENFNDVQNKNNENSNTFKEAN